MSIAFSLRRISFWFKNARPQSLPQSLFPAVLAACMASSYESFSWMLAVMGIVGVVAGHLGLNLFDDYFDHKKARSDYRERMTHQGFRARMGKCRYLTSGEATIKQLFTACCTFSFIAILLGTIILWHQGVGIAYFIGVTAFLGLSYSGSPLQLSYRGLGELLIGVMFGPLVMMGTFYAACGTISPSIVLVSVPVGLLVANIVYVHSIMDYEPDKQIGKHTLAVLLDNRKAMLAVLVGIIVTVYGIILAGILLGYLSVWYLLLSLTLPMAASLLHLMKEYVRDPQLKFRTRFWMGPMGDWKRIEAMGIDWFMIRWFLARNLLSLFCLIILFINHF